VQSSNHERDYDIKVMKKYKQIWHTCCNEKPLKWKETSHNTADRRNVSIGCILSVMKFVWVTFQPTVLQLVHLGNELAVDSYRMMSWGWS